MAGAGPGIIPSAPDISLDAEVLLSDQALFRAGRYPEQALRIGVILSANGSQTLIPLEQHFFLRVGNIAQDRFRHPRRGVRL